MKNFWTKLASAAAALLLSAGLSFAVYQSSVDGIGLGSTATPVLTSCGGGTPTAVGNDMAGTVTMGTSATGCVITFSSAKSSAPHCVVTWIATPLASQSYATSTTAITLTQTSTSSNVVKYICMGL